MSFGPPLAGGGVRRHPTPPRGWHFRRGFLSYLTLPSLRLGKSNPKRTPPPTRQGGAHRMDKKLCCDVPNPFFRRGCVLVEGCM